ncbi:MAG: hypothetical protein HRU38_17845 [Saccharospirillaceae bacterium]|nr:hypothetical protein [Pseudomonadales bacterium]NRB80502.1 hypothetical protein [Saccharospirillaceae bacterium]
MKNIIRTLFAFVLTPLESGDEEYVYRPSHRKILIIMGVMFTALASGVLFIIPAGELGYYLPVVIFGGGGILSIAVGSVGSDRAVSKIWGTK